MPMMVRLVDGKQPVTSSAKSSSFKFVPELRLFSTIQEELIFGMPLSQSSSKEPLSLLPLPLSVPLKFQVCRNMGQVEQMKEFCRLQEKIKTLVDQTKNLIQMKRRYSQREVETREGEADYCHCQICDDSRTMMTCKE
jgi:hypothetical protein